MATTVLTAENARQGGRRKAKSGEAAAQKVKKQPQRGMGVAQLERLRLQERWNKMTEIGNVPPQPLSLHNPYSLSLNLYPIPVSTTQFGHGLNPAFFRNGSVEGVFPGKFQESVRKLRIRVLGLAMWERPRLILNTNLRVSQITHKIEMVPLLDCLKKYDN
ncbi:hypothetical protein Acr_17g0004340 [Actinidia rufa]|uniref:Uncharacterized protein n=1 Tax=Actinidia rufa TaxID=165716 RepID=A0A7J0G265_9ERIC|nr:hypothetical protein Acr_17g0004340 [Actinidia rufa]